MAEDIPVDPCPQVYIDIAKTWIETCESHSSCSLVTRTKLPKRILDLGPHRLRNAISLVEVEDDNYGRYLTLSHCWGGVQHITTTKSTLRNRLISIRMSELPQTYRDAITVCRGLGVRYLWIDSLCILQDDRLDWEQQSAKMASIYAGSYLNIAATRAPSSTNGFFSSRWAEVDVNMSCRAFPVQSFEIVGKFEEQEYRVRVRLSLDRGHGDFKVGIGTQTYRRRAPLFSRAWVFQERCLAPRTLHFHADELIWECRTTIRCECNGLDAIEWSQNWRRAWNALHLELEAADFLELADRWLEVVARFAALRLSYESDRLPALSGVASRFQGSLLKTYVAGMWKEDLLRGLLWHVGFNWISSSRRPLPLRAPTWSWASMLLNKEVDSIFYPFIMGEFEGFEQEPFAKVLETHCYSSGVNPYGEVSGGTLILQSSFNSAILSVRKRLRPFVELIRDIDIEEDDLVLILVATVFGDVALTESDMDGEPPSPARIVECLFLGHSPPQTDDGSRWTFDYGLVVKSSTSPEDSYERVGFLKTVKRMSRSYENWFNRTAIGVFKLK